LPKLPVVVDVSRTSLTNHHPTEMLKMVAEREEEEEVVVVVVPPQLCQM